MRYPPADPRPPALLGSRTSYIPLMILPIQVLTQAALLARLASPYPFSVGETLRYEARLGYFPVGTAEVSVTRMVQERGSEAFEFAMAGEGGPPGWRGELQSHLSCRYPGVRITPVSPRMVQAGKVDEHGISSSRLRPLPGRGGLGDWMAPSQPLDELAFLYFLRTAPLQVGKTYSLQRYFKTGYNPIQVRVRRESCAMPNGSSTSCLAVEVSSRGQTMRVWFTDDKQRLPAQAEIPLPFGSVTLSLVEAGGREMATQGRIVFNTSPGSYRSPTGSRAGCTAGLLPASLRENVRSGALPGRL